MGYRLKAGRPIDSEVRRVADRQLELAIALMRTIEDHHGGEAVMVARRHVKKVRALIRLVTPALRGRVRGAVGRLSVINRFLAPIADSQAAIDTARRLGARYGRQLPHRGLLLVRRALRDRFVRIDRQAKIDRVPQTAIRLLRAEQRRVQTWRLSADGFEAVRRGLRKTVRRSRRAMAVALARPTDRTYHVWRCRVKDHWFQVRLIQRWCGGAFAEDERRLAELDECLGEHHNCALLHDVLVGESILTRLETTRMVRILRRYRGELRRDAQRLGAEQYAAPSREFVRRARHAWRAAAQPEEKRTTPWARAA